MVNGAHAVNQYSQTDAVRQFHDTIAPVYDAIFSEGGSGDVIRRKVQHALLMRFKPGDHVLELNCGTGTDAIVLASHGIHVTATDISPRMVEMTEAKARAAGVDSMISTAVVDAATLGDLDRSGFDGAFSNFNGLNYLDDVSAFAGSIGAVLKPGGTLFCTLLNRICLWEVLYFAVTLRPGRALNRIIRRNEELMVSQKPLTLRLYFPHEFALYFARDFFVRNTTGFGILLPPAGLGTLYKSRARLLGVLAQWETRIAGVYPLYSVCDHFLVEFQKRNGS